MLDSPALAEPTVIGNGDVRQVSYGNDRGLYVEFHTEDVYQEFESEREGRPIYKQVPFISIFVPGDKTKKVTRPVRDQWFGDTPPDTERFPQQWAAYQRGAQALSTGLPLAEWPVMTTSQVKALNHANIFTVEQLAEVSDANLETLGHGGRMLRDKAVGHLARLNDQTMSARLEAQNADLQRQIEELRASISPDNAPRRGPGRPPKNLEGINEDAE